MIILFFSFTLEMHWFGQLSVIFVFDFPAVDQTRTKTAYPQFSDRVQPYKFYFTKPHFKFFMCRKVYSYSCCKNRLTNKPIHTMRVKNLKFNHGFLMQFLSIDASISTFIGRFTLHNIIMNGPYCFILIFDLIIRPRDLFF